jgi:hypothetical protein
LKRARFHPAVHRWAERVARLSVLVAIVPAHGSALPIHFRMPRLLLRGVELRAVLVGRDKEVEPEEDDREKPEEDSPDDFADSFKCFALLCVGIHFSFSFPLSEEPFSRSRQHYIIFSFRLSMRKMKYF